MLETPRVPTLAKSNGQGVLRLRTQVSAAEIQMAEGLHPVERLLAMCRLAENANYISDVHISQDQKPWVTIDGRVECLVEFDPISVDDIKAFLDDSLGEAGLHDFHDSARNYATCSRTETAYGTVRIHAAKATQTPGIHMTIRLLRLTTPLLKDLNLPDSIADLVNCPNGLILLTGATGSGKSTAAAAIINEINNAYPYRIYTAEDPIEYILKNKKSNITQFAVGSDIPSYLEGIRSMLRMAPNVIFIGEMRDGETMRAAIVAAETGHLVISTMHDNGAEATVQRILGSFDGPAAKEMRMQFANVMRAIVSLRLIPRKNSEGRVPVTEIMTNTPSVRVKILDETKTSMLRSEMSQGKEHGMHTLESDLKAKVKANEITLQEAIKFANEPDDLKDLQPLK